MSSTRHRLRRAVRDEDGPLDAVFDIGSAPALAFGVPRRTGWDQFEQEPAAVLSHSLADLIWSASATARPPARRTLGSRFGSVVVELPWSPSGSVAASPL